MFTRVLVANRGEIALRIFRTLRDMGIGSVAVYSDVDRTALHTLYADEALALGGSTSAETYLVVSKLIAAAARSGAEAVHPGYGFLAENAGFARAVEEAGLVWIGPPPAAIELMGSKIRARRAMQAAGVPIIPGTIDPVGSAEEVAALGAEIGYPLLIKAAAGGGGKGMKVVRSDGEAAQAFESARREGQSYFADASVYVERYLEDPRHVEVQVLADAHGNVIHLGERDCTIQRRHQKLVEETPSPGVGPQLRNRIGKIAVDAARAAGYRSAGTIEGLLTRDGAYYFMEMNTRIQVEHTITEMATGIDIVRAQLQIAAGERLEFSQDEISLQGHAIECRINAEDVSNSFLPSPGTITTYREPSGPGVRVDSGVTAGSEVSPLYDPMIAKLIVRGADREDAIGRMLRALGEFEIGGIKTLVGFHRALLSHPCFRAGETCHGIVESELLALRAAELASEPVRGAAPAVGRKLAQTTFAQVDGRRVEVKVLVPEPPHRELARRRRERAAAAAAAAAGGAGSGAVVVSPMQGTVLDVKVAEGDTVEAGQVVCIVEAMKMENEVAAHRSGTIVDVAVSAGQPVSSGQPICTIDGGE
ncbi:MAG TPA: acetyl-CoA carboxylase biotin carboxylase subunit [Vicinamibacterales bacterium]|nr:acetyl-CoA carboxylase biotin carboxylase subunit [Vicinamibacterales bacterium]